MSPRLFHCFCSLFLGCIAPSFAQNLPALDEKRLAALLGSPKSQIAYIANTTQDAISRIDVVELDAQLNPQSRTNGLFFCVRVSALEDGRLFCFTSKTVGPDGKQRTLQPPARFLYANGLKSVLVYGSADHGSVSRARISADGKYLADTVFVQGHDYTGNSGLTFSTSTAITHTTPGGKPENLQKWRISLTGRIVNEMDLNLWGVSFHPKDSNQFMVTVSFKGRPHLGLGNIASRSIEVIEPDVECPSYSPDGERIGFKHKIENGRWLPAVMDLKSRQRTIFQIDRSLDDQVVWLTNHDLLFELVDRPTLTSLPAVHIYRLDTRNPKAQPELWLRNARSPAPVLRGG